jgi:4-amino-4-deoxy-L-arabinose transferase-like glycosyltransferase
MTDVLDPALDRAAPEDPARAPDVDETSPEEVPGSRVSRARAVWCVGTIALAAAIWAVAGSLWLFPLLTDNADEAAYLSQSAGLRAGDLLVPAPAASPAAFQPWFSALTDGNFVYKYTPVHASFIATAHTLFTSDRALLAIVAIADVVLLALLARELGASRGAAVLACLVFVLSPLWIVQSATFLPYAESLALLQAFLVLLLRGSRTGSPPQLALSGLLAGIAVFARPFDGVLFVGTALAWYLWRVRRTTVTKAMRWFALGVVPAAVLFFAYNAIATGSMFRLAFHVTGSSDTLGFGSRHVLRSDAGVDYTVWKAIRALTNNMELVITWTFGSFLALILAGIGFSSARDLKGRTFLALLLLVWPLGFFFFWGAYASVLLWDITQFVGPFYYLPMLMALAIGAGVGIARVARGRAWVGAGIVAVLAAVTLVTLLPAIDTNQERTAQRRVVNTAVERLDDTGPTLLFLPPIYGPYLQNPFSWLRNSPGYDGHIVYALDAGNRNFDLVDQFPGRTPYTMSIPTGYGGDRPAGLTKAFTNRVRHVTASSVAVEARVSSGLLRRGAVLSVIFGFKVVPVHFAPDGDGGGVTRFTITRTDDGRVTLTDENDPTAHTVIKRLRHELQLGVIVGSGNDRSIAYGRIVPIRSTDRGFELLMPGTVSNDQLGIFDRATLDVTLTK